MANDFANGLAQYYKQRLIHGLSILDSCIEQGMPESQLLGVLLCEAELGSTSARMLLLCHQQALMQVWEAEKVAAGIPVQG